jgi:prophage DNA circulation protein
MGTIRDISALALTKRQPATVWRDQFMPAHYDGFPFHVEAASRESGRRIALHEFPKKELPYAEDMGHTAVAFTVRGYIIVYPHEDVTAEPGSLYQRDYRNARDLLRQRLDQGGPGVLQLPTFVGRTGPMIVVCTRYRLTEESRTGGYCVFDMQFVERGKRPFAETPDSQNELYTQTRALREQVKKRWELEANKGQKTFMGTFNPLVRTGQKQIMGPFNPLVRFIGPPKKMGPIRPKTSPNESEFTTKSTGTASQQMEMWQRGRA